MTIKFVIITASLVLFLSLPYPPVYIAVILSDVASDEFQQYSREAITKLNPQSYPQSAAS